MPARSPSPSPAAGDGSQLRRGRADARARGGRSPGPLDDRFYDLVESRFRRVVEEEPAWATHLGIHAWDDRLADSSRERVLARHRAGQGAPRGDRGAGPGGALRGGEIRARPGAPPRPHPIFRADTLRIWERRSTGASALGDALFHLFTRDFAPLPERLASIAARLEARAALPEGLPVARGRRPGPAVARDRAAGERQRARASSTRSGPRRISRERRSPDAERRRLRAAIDGAKVAIEDQAEWIRGDPPGRHAGLAASARERYDELLRLRAFDGLDADAILEIGWEQLERNHADRRAAAREIDPDATEMAVVERVKDDHPATFEEALEGYRRDMAPRPRAPHRARPRDDPARRAGRGHPDARVPARRHAVRRVLRAGALGSVADRHVRRHPVGRRSPRRPARALPGRDQQHEHPRGLPGPPPAARARGAPPVADPRPGRRPGVRRGLGHVQRADAPRARLRRRAGVPRRARDGRDLAGRADRARRPDAPRRAVDRGGDRVPRRAHRLRAPERPRRGAPLHVHADVQPVVPAREGAPAPAARRRGAPARERVLAARLPRRPAARRLAPDQLPPPGAARRGPHRPLRAGSGSCRSSRRSTSSAAGRGSCSGPASRPASAHRPTGRSGSPSTS